MCLEFQKFCFCSGWKLWAHRFFQPSRRTNLISEVTNWRGLWYQHNVSSFTLGSSKDFKAKVLTGTAKFEQYNWKWGRAGRRFWYFRTDLEKSKSENPQYFKITLATWLDVIMPWFNTWGLCKRTLFCFWSKTGISNKSLCESRRGIIN